MIRPPNPKTDPESDQYRLVEALWEGSAEVMHVDPDSAWDKAVFFAGIKAAILAIDRLLPEGDEPPEVLILKMLTDCDDYFREMQQGLDESRAARKS